MSGTASGAIDLATFSHAASDWLRLTGARQSAATRSFGKSALHDEGHTAGLDLPDVGGDATRQCCEMRARARRDEAGSAKQRLERLHAQPRVFLRDGRHRQATLFIRGEPAASRRQFSTMKSMLRRQVPSVSHAMCGEATTFSNRSSG